MRRLSFRLFFLPVRYFEDILTNGRPRLVTLSLSPLTSFFAAAHLPKRPFSFCRLDPPTSSLSPSFGGLCLFPCTFIRVLTTQKGLVRQTFTEPVKKKIKFQIVK